MRLLYRENLIRGFTAIIVKVGLFAVVYAAIHAVMAAQKTLAQIDAKMHMTCKTYGLVQTTINWRRYYDRKFTK